MIKYSLRIILIAFINIPLLFPQMLQVEQLNTSNGLSNNKVHCFYQDSYGLLWIGTEHGLNVYDGYEFKIFRNEPDNSESINSDVIWQITEDSNKNLWIATGEGVSIYKRNSNQFRNYNFTGDYYGSIFIYRDKKDNIWAASNGKNLVRYNAEKDSWDEQTLVLIDSARSYDVPNYVSCIIEDNHDRLWIASIRYGLMKYDKKQKVFRQSDIMNTETAMSFTATDNWITALYSDPSGLIWITTRNGIYIYDTNKEKLKTIKRYTKNRLGMWNDQNSISKDPEGNIWIANNFKGCLKFDGTSDTFSKIKFVHSTGAEEKTPEMVFSEIFFDSEGILWAGTMTEGILKYDPHRKIFTHYEHNEWNKQSLSSSQIFTLQESKIYPGKIYVGTRGGGLNLFDRKTKNFAEIPYKTYNDIYGGSVSTIFEEIDGTLWLGTWGDGLLKMDPQKKVIRRLCTDSTNTECITDDHINKICGDEYGNLWIGTLSGLNYLDRNAKKVLRYNREITCYQDELINLLKKKISLNSEISGITKVKNSQKLETGFTVNTQENYLIAAGGEGDEHSTAMWDYGWIENSSQQILWSSGDASMTYHLSGDFKNRIKIDVINLKPGKYTLKYISDDNHSYGNWNSAPPAEQDLWGIRIFRISDKSELEDIQACLNELTNRPLIKGLNITTLHRSKNGYVWVGTESNGLYRINLSNENVKAYPLRRKNHNTSFRINEICEDGQGFIWVASSMGLVKFDPQKETFAIYTEKDGLPANQISSILLGERDELWLGTQNGISKLKITGETGAVEFVNYGLDDGLGGMDYSPSAALKTSDGRYFFGGDHGLTEFTSKGGSSSPPRMILSDLKISNQSVLLMGEESPIRTALPDLDNLSLSWSQNNLIFEFAALHYSNPKKNKYAHKLEGYERDWIYDNNRSVTYTNLDPGKYMFRFKGSNSDGIWNESGRSILIIISPPFWRTWWAYTFYTIVFVGILFVVRRYELKRRKNKEDRRIMELEIRRKNEELEQARRLQLSMLPKQIPEIPGLDIAVHMATASEVGGDYYDFSRSEDNSLTAVLGDATGHGLDAGMMVSVTKGLFKSLSPHPNLEYIISQFNESILSMNLQPMYMSLHCIRIRNNQLEFTGAGMPPLLYHSRSSRTVVEIESAGPPLGGFPDFNFTACRYELSPGDIIVLLSDGFPERRRQDGKIFGWNKGKELLHSMTDLSSREIITGLTKANDDWAGDMPQDDDITFIVIKVK